MRIKSLFTLLLLLTSLTSVQAADKYLIGKLSSHGFEPILATTDAVVQSFTKKDGEDVEKGAPLVELYPYLYPKSQIIKVKSRKSGIFVEKADVQLGSKVTKGEVLGYVHSESFYLLDALVSSEEVSALQTQDTTPCLKIKQECFDLQIQSTHASQYAEIERVRFTFPTTEQHAHQAFLPNSKFIIILKSKPTVSEDVKPS